MSYLEIVFIFNLTLDRTNKFGLFSTLNIFAALFMILAAKCQSLTSVLYSILYYLFKSSMNHSLLFPVIQRRSLFLIWHEAGAWLSTYHHIIKYIFIYLLSYKIHSTHYTWYSSIIFDNSISSLSIIWPLSTLYLIRLTDELY